MHDEISHLLLTNLKAEVGLDLFCFTCFKDPMYNIKLKPDIYIHFIKWHCLSVWHEILQNVSILF